eukprot:89429-Prymnesium_polylepis.1
MAITWQSHDNHMAITWQSHGNHMAITCALGIALANSVSSSHWLRFLAERTSPDSHSASSGRGVLTKAMSPSCQRCMRRGGQAVRRSRGEAVTRRGGEAVRRSRGEAV